MVEKRKLYIYPAAQPHVHDDVPEYYNVTPMSRQGILDHFEIVKSENKADFFYMGQFSDGRQGEIKKENFYFFDDYPEKHICDIEGDWNNKFPNWLENCIITINGLRQEWVGNNNKFFVRPTFSKLLVHLVKSPPEDFDKFFLSNLGKKSFGFQGFPDPFGVRKRMEAIIKIYQIPAEIVFTDKWNGPTSPNSPQVESYVNLMKRHIFSLCPRGNGVDSVRFLESCAFARVPVVIGDNILFGQNYANLTFVTKINPNTKQDIYRDILKDLFDENNKYLNEYKSKAFDYFHGPVREYFRDPTKFFLDRLDKNEMVSK